MLSTIVLRTLKVLCFQELIDKLSSKALRQLEQCHFFSNSFVSNPHLLSDQDTEKNPTLKIYLLLFLSWSFYSDAAAAKRKINVRVNDELEHIIEEEKGGQRQEWKNTSHCKAEGQPTKE